MGRLQIPIQEEVQQGSGVEGLERLEGKLVLVELVELEM